MNKTNQTDLNLLLTLNPFPQLQIDACGEITYCNPAAQSLLTEWGTSAEEGLKGAWLEWIREVIAQGTGCKEYYSSKQKLRLHGYYQVDKKLVNVYAQEVTTLSQIDTLTALPTLNVFKQRLHAHLQSLAEQKETHSILLIIDIKHFKELNLRYGYTTGDAVLKELALRTENAFSSALVMGRIAGNEFAVAFELAFTPEVLQDINEKLQQLQRPFHIEDNRLTVELVTGLVASVKTLRSADKLLSQAQLALNHARVNNEKQQIYSGALAETQHRRALVRDELENSIRNNDFFLVFEPQVSLQSRRIVGAEALIRWHHAELGEVSPTEFIPIAEQSGKIMEITRWVVRQAFQQLQNWQAMRLELVPISVNISAQELTCEDLLLLLNELSLDDATLLSYLHLEITETFLLHDFQASLVMLEKIKALGLKISIDDFGTGYSSLSYLSQLSADKLKIDRSFIRNLFNCPENQVITNSILDLAKRLNLKVCAEGIETEQQLAYLQARGCHEGQGYYFSRPQSAVAFTESLKLASAGADLFGSLYQRGGSLNEEPLSSLH